MYVCVREFKDNRKMIKGDIWCHVINAITDMHPCKTDSQIWTRGGSSGDSEQGEVNTCKHRIPQHLCSQSQAILRWFQLLQLGTPHQVLILLILWQSSSSTSLVTFHFPLMVEVVCEQKVFVFFFFSFPQGLEWESMRHFTCCCVAVYITC